MPIRNSMRAMKLEFYLAMILWCYPKIKFCKSKYATTIDLF